MKTLILMRHAKSDMNQPGQRDKDRTLNETGRQDAARMGAWLRDNGHTPQAALVSSAERTRETWALLGFDCEARFDDSLYLGEPEDLLAAIRTAPDCPCLLVLAHNPGMERAMGMMNQNRRANAPSAATGVYRLTISAWAEAEYAAGKCLAFETPKSLV